MGKERLVVIGGVAAGMSAASSYRRLKPEAEAIVLEKDYFISYGACSLPYYVSDDVKDFQDLISLTPKVATAERGITVFTRHEATAIDFSKKEVLARDLDKNEEKRIPYDKLVIATGGLPVKPPLPGIDLQNVFTIRTLIDGIEMKKFINEWGSFQVCVGSPECLYVNRFGAEKRAMKTVIVGGGYIGMEMCESFRKRGLDVAVIEKMDRVLGTMDKSITDVVDEKVQAEGVKLFKETSVEGFEGSKGAVTGVRTDKGIFDADLVLLAIGARPNTKLVQDAGIELGANGAVKVDDYLRTNMPDVYAAGDCAEAKHLVTGKKVYIPLGTTANKQGRIAGENAAGKDNIFEGVVGTAITKVFDLEVARTGLSPLEAEREGYDFFVSTIKGRSRSSAYPSGKRITVSYSVERGTGRLLGAQMVGEEGVAHRIDTLAACLYSKMTVEDVARLDLGYAPPFATVWDPILVAANVAVKKLTAEKDHLG
ncbi:MAG TPA: FAD-dependent oxidoreductase [Syntrophorhabdaceae bacterium]|nr:FAD-dependent oxidoreductase [Syntrophorhabdaceae bacterium]HQM80634.1 FAD-dependent oxidoreductase [Syntrophorhabdaceae bacterium]